MILLIWFLFVGIMIAINWYIIKEKKISPLHPLNAAIVILSAWGLEHFDFRPHWFCRACFLLTYWWLFDSGLNIACGWPIQNLGTTGFIDRTLKPYEAPVFWFKSILFIGFTLSYYFNY